jgi:hypothetical protein
LPPATWQALAGIALGTPRNLTKTRRQGLEPRLAQRLQKPQIKISIQQEPVKQASPM